MTGTNPTPEAARAAVIAQGAADGAAWLEKNRAAASPQDDPVAQAFRRFGRRANRLRVAAGRPTCVAVFGASQAGKSYLVSGLACQSGKSLTANYGGQTLDFLKDMNPQGDKEATGLVTRFTVSPTPAPATMPIPLRLMSQTDVVKILANAFLEDCKLEVFEPMDAATVAALFDGLEAVAGPVAQAGLTMDDVEEMREYFSLHFRNHPMLQELGAAFWARAAKLIPRLPAARRAEAYAPLWNGTTVFTRLATTLITALEGIGFPDTAFCGIDVLTPREQGILNADTVFQVSQGGCGMVRVQGTNGTAGTMDRAQLAALVAELTFPLAEPPWDFLHHTDLLDFPGARSREYIRHLSLLDEPDRLGRLFLRGKVAYLYQRYNAEQEIAAMLLCVGPSNQDVQTLPEMIAAWIDQTMGATPAARATQRNSLFFILTKFDSEFIEKAGEDIASGQRWTTRLQASLLDFFGKAYKWPTDWANGQPFNNCFWLRSTAVRFPAVFDYAEISTYRSATVETMAPRAARFLEPRHAAYLGNESVRAHFADPERAWQEALRENDGGISYLGNQLRPVCNPALKAEQIAGRLEELAADISARLRPHFHDGDIAAELARAQERARVLRRDLVACAKAQRFGALLRALQVTPDQITSVYWRLQSEGGEEAAPIGTVSGYEEYDELGDMGDVAPPGAHGQARDRFDRLAEIAIEDWVLGMQTFAESGEPETRFHISRDNALLMVGEIARAARRLNLRPLIAQALHARASFQNRGAAGEQKRVIVLEQMINGFIHTLGFGLLPPDQRPSPANASRRIFAPRDPVAGLPPIGAQPTPYDTRFNVDWMTAISHTIENNVRDAASGLIDIEENARLGQILKQLEPLA